MYKKELAAAETIGAILLTAIIAGAIGIFCYQWISQIPTSSPVSTNLEIACGNGNLLSSNDFNCRSGVISCSADLILPYGDCIKTNCSVLPSSQYQECVKICESETNCADINNSKNCNTIFICHNGGDSLEISNLEISINKGDFLKAPFLIYNATNETNISNISNGEFNRGEILRIPIQDNEKPLESVIMMYQNENSDEKNVIVSKRFR